MSATYRYSALRTKQTPESGWLISLSAPAIDIDSWAGIPQKQKQGGEETLGFQREENKGRIAELKEFYNDAHNVIQNPLLCATRENLAGKVTFEKKGESSDPLTEIGEVLVEVEDLDSYSLKELMRRVKLSLEQRITALNGQAPDAALVTELKRKANVATPSGEETDVTEEDAEATNGEPGEVEDEESATSPLFTDESHIFDFWNQLAARLKVLDDGDPQLGEAQEFLGFTRDSMKSFLKPVVLVDGQHRLRGALQAARDEVVSNPKLRESVELAITDGEEPEAAQRKVERSIARRLPISLLTTTDPAEHVFQFVVVNQKATPIGRALLGTIISTTLSNEELERVSERLETAGIPLEESRAVAFLARNPTSPFCNRVEQGLPSEEGDRLPWTVMRSLVQIFQHLKGGKLFNSKVDHANRWKRTQLGSSALVAAYAEHGAESAFEYWSRPDGPWRDVFITFWKSIRDKFGVVDDTQAKNYWGSPRTSQLFNKISLTILAADFFQYLNGGRITINSLDEIPGLIDDWTDGVTDSYFSRAWKLEGIKKDDFGIRKQWAKLWNEYRQDPSAKTLPKLDDYRKPIP